MSVDFDVRGNDGMELLTGFHSVINYGLLFYAEVMN